MNMDTNKVEHKTISAKIIQVLAGGEISVSQLFHNLEHFTTNGGVVQTIQWRELPYTTALPSEVILVGMDGNSRTFVFERTLKHGPWSHTHTYKNRADSRDLLRLVHII